MDTERRIEAFVWLGSVFKQFLNNEWDNEELKMLFNTEIEKASYLNPWFNQENIRKSLQSIATWLSADQLKEFASKHEIDFSNHEKKKVGVIMAGNIPLVGFHDLLCVLLSGHHLVAKPSSDDTILIKLVHTLLLRFDDQFDREFQLTDSLLKGMDAYIATGSNQSSTYFEYYFAKVPHIIRKNRTSVAVLNGNESELELRKLGDDIYSYFGLGCRSITALRLPPNYDIMELLKHWVEHSKMVQLSKYLNNYDYQKASLLICNKPFIDNGFSLLVNDSKLQSPVSVINFIYYNELNDVIDEINNHAKSIQCVVSTSNEIKNAVSPGMAQCPTLYDFADNINTMEFLSKIK